jgi:Cu+-exporting ATPase
MPVEKNLVEIKFLVEGITCTGCAMDMENIILDMDGVEEATVNYTDGIFIIQYNPGEIEEKNIIKKVKNLGFKTKLAPEKT